MVGARIANIEFGGNQHGGSVDRPTLSRAEAAMVGASIANMDQGVGHGQKKAVDRPLLSQPESAIQVTINIEGSF